MASKPGNPSPDRDLIAKARAEAGELPTSTGESSASEEVFAPLPPAGTFPGYDVIRSIQRGGQGVVYLAVQQSTRRQVALKVPREGAFARFDDLARFEREIEILARLEHPNIVTILDRGVTHGRHWFVMDYIAGPTLDAWISDSRRTREEILTVFMKICRAIHAAHMQGVIHRDLKPANIRIDQANEPHILDFGLAKPIGEVDDAIEMTQAGDFIGTPVWASPEQLAREPSRVGTLTDVYSLGLILYKLLTGRSAFAQPLHRMELLEAIRRAGPEPASSVSKDVDNELSTIVGKCLRHEQSERYQSVHELAADIEHYLAGEPIEAKRDSHFYLLRKALWKHRAIAGLAAASFAVVCAIAAYAWVQRNEAIDQRRAAEQAGIANAAFVDLFREQAESIDPTIASPGDVRMQNVLDEIEPGIERMKGEPATLALIRSTFGRMYLGLTDRVKAEKHLSEALKLHEAAIDGDEIEELQLREEIGRAIMRRGDVASMSRAETLQADVLARREAIFGVDSAEAAQSQDALAAVYYWQGKHKEAEAADRAALKFRRAKLGDNDPLVARSVHQVGLRLLTRGKREPDATARAELLAEAMTNFQESISILEKRGRRRDLGILSARTKIASCLMWQRRLDEAEAELVTATALAEEWLTESDSRRTEPLLLLAQMRYMQREDPGAALGPARTCLDGRLKAASDRRFGVEKPPPLDEVASLVQSTGRLLDIAEPALIYGLALVDTAETTTIAVVGENWLVIARRIHEVQERPSEAALAEHDAAIGHAMARGVALGGDSARLAQAVDMLADAIARFEKVLRPDDPRVKRAQKWLAEAQGGG